MPMASTLAALGALGVNDGSGGPQVTSAPTAVTDAPAAQPDLGLEEMEEGERSPTPRGRSSTDRELSLLLQNLHKAIDATSKGAPFPVSSAVHTTLPFGGGVPSVASPVSDPAVKFDKWLNRARLDKPTKFDGESGEGGDRVKAFLSELQRYFAVTDLPFVSWGAVTPHFLEKSALLMWELEFQGIIVAHGPSAVTWSMFEKFMHDQYGQLQPACETRAAYEELRQSDFDSVSSFIRAFRIKERELLGTAYHPGGGAIFDFIRKLTPAVRKYVQDNAPEEWWTDVSQVYKKALNYELNRRAAVQGDSGVT